MESSKVARSSPVWDVPELSESSSFIRVSPDTNVPVTDRVLRLVDTSGFRRLSRMSQLGLVSYVYPGATHTRFEHSLGVFRNAIEYVNRLACDSVFCELMTDRHIRLLLVSALLHDIGHWPFCHAIEDMRLDGLPRHETLAKRLISSDEIAHLLMNDWQLGPAEVANVLTGTIGKSVVANPLSKEDRAIAILVSILSGPIDIDKIDYLERDSLHAGVPYGRNFDRHRLISSLCIDPAQHRLAITDKGRTAAEMMVFARYIMFSEVYWHHSVRSATAMLQHAIHELVRSGSTTDRWLDMTESQLMESVRSQCSSLPVAPCAEGLFGPRRQLYKRVAQFDVLSHPEQHRKLSRRPFVEIVELSKSLASLIRARYGIDVQEHDLLIDAPPVKLEVQCQIDVRQRDGSLKSLGEMSPVVHTLATRQFDDIVKRVRIFVRPDLRERVVNIDFAALVATLID
jgi:HD superfamily phosphohydrolase